MILECFEQFYASPEKPLETKEEKKSEPNNVGDDFDIEWMIKTLNAEEQAYLNGNFLKKEAEEIFMKADEDVSNSLHGDQIAAGVELVLSYYPHRREALIISEESATELLLKFDGNKSGTIEKEEFFQFVRWIVAREVYDYFNTPIVEKSG